MTDSNPRVSHLNTILEALQVSTPPDALAWLREGMEHPSDAGVREEQLATRFPAVLRRLGRDPLCTGRCPLHTPCGDMELGSWTRGDAGRACLLLSLPDEDLEGLDSLIRRLYRNGDEKERASIVRFLCLLPWPCSLLDLALETGRINSLELYAALALDNPFPAACYDDHAFNGLVLKCLFNGLPVARISGLLERANPELSRMCEDYRDERVAAGRRVPPDLWLALEPHAGPRGLDLILTALNDEDPAHRYNSIIALDQRRKDPRIGAALRSRLAQETDAELRRILEPPTS